MPAESAADRATFVSTDDFGTSATYRAISGTSATVSGIFDAPFEAVDVEAGAPVGSRNASFECVTADLPSDAAQCDEIDIGSDTYIVAEIENDETGMTVLVLDKL